ncbi:hypothetical protein B4U80_03793, partial [Leptotrombidium deliense]
MQGKAITGSLIHSWKLFAKRGEKIIYTDSLFNGEPSVMS